MNSQDRQRLVRRILNGYLYTDVYFKQVPYKVKFVDPSPEILSEIDYEIDKINKDAEDLMSLEESYEILTKEGQWSDNQDIELDKLKIDMKLLNSRLLQCKFKLIEKRNIESIIEKRKVRIIDLEEKKNALYNNTKEHFLDHSFKKLLISRITHGLSVETMRLSGMLETLIVCYYKDNFISEKVIRELARSDPWRIFWITSKTTSTPLFRNPVGDMTDLQYILVSWSRIYDYAFEHSESPGDDIINNDIEFDAWYQSECDKSKQRQKTVSSGISNGKFSTSELFIPADIEGAQKVYELNDPVTRKKIKNRQKIIEKEQYIAEGDLPDVRKEIMMHANKMAGQKIKERG